MPLALTFGESLTMTEAGNSNGIFQHFAITFKVMLGNWMHDPTLPCHICFFKLPNNTPAIKQPD